MDDEAGTPKSPTQIDKSFEQMQREFDFSDACEFARCGMEVSTFQLIYYFSFWLF